MIDILLVKHRRKHDVYELVKAFFPFEEVNFINSLEESLEGNILLISSLIDNERKLSSECQIYKNDDLLFTHEEDISSIGIFQDKIRDTIEKNIKIGIKKAIYLGLTKISNQDMFWGILTGIRPNKVVHDLLDKGYDRVKIESILSKEYLLDKDKARSLLDIAEIQRPYLYPLDKDRFSLYVNIPFCPSRCTYCSFPTLLINKYDAYIEAYTNQLIKEIDILGDLLKEKEINTVYIGGGTPTSIPSFLLERIIQKIYSTFGINNIKEFTVEAGRPDSLDDEYLGMLNSQNIGRISINPQSMVDKTLVRIGRNHTSKDIVSLYNKARSYDFLINMDLIIGLPGEGLDGISYTLKEIKTLDPDNLTIHTLALKQGSKFKESLDIGRLQSQDLMKQMFQETSSRAKEMRLRPYYLYKQKRSLGNYENIGYSKPSKECIYNMIIMEEKETIIGAGMGAVTKIFLPDENRIERLANFKSIHDYLNRFDDLISKKRRIFQETFYKEV